MPIRRKKSKKPLIIAIAVSIALLGAGLWAYAYFSNRGTDDDTRTVNEINYDPPTVEEKAAGDEQKKKLEPTKPDENTDPSDPPEDSNQVKVVITDAGQYDDIIEIRSFIPDHYQDGTCTVTLTKGTTTVTKETTAYRDASTTICTNPLIKRSEFPSAGDWTVRVQYASANARGTSELQTITIK